ncbi:hypothetical protein GDO81_006631 [Engystomops pustulosus]|uniref:sn-1-specific diacylglycerol lipase ABHD11 n=1 Tax=Engystomops pustulosus TaxID=76066 RepID=A0AAV7D1H1_ENGPU|nr:hypothetical protein GDO81_006631 [Engystomops pustulosus]
MAFPSARSKNGADVTLPAQSHDKGEAPPSQTVSAVCASVLTQRSAVSRQSVQHRMPLLAAQVCTGVTRSWGRLARITCRASTGPLLLTKRSNHGGVVTLSYDLFDGKAPGPPLVLLHGLFGSKSNFQSIAKALVRRIGRKVLTLDARNHGSSPHSDTITYHTMSDDVRHLLQQLNISSCVLIGHSMGGKTAMTLALQEVSKTSADCVNLYSI